MFVSMIERVLRKCGDDVTLLLHLDENPKPANEGRTTYRIDRVLIRRRNDCCEIIPPFPTCGSDPAGSYWVNRVILSDTIVDEWKSSPLTEDEVRDMICNGPAHLFACYSE